MNSPATVLPRTDASPAPSPEIHVLIDEDIHIAYSSRLRRHRWEEATFTFRSALVTGGGVPRRYGPNDPWAEAVADPRLGYARVGGKLKRHAEPGRDYDPVRHLRAEDAR
jgi:hypothetical protein